MKKFICIMLGFMLVLSIATGCSSSKDKGKDNTFTAVEKEGTKQGDIFNKTGYPIMNKPAEITLMHGIASQNGPWEDMHYFKAMEKITNIKIKFLSIEGSAYVEKKNLAFASGDIPDVVWGLSQDEEVKYGVEGKVLIPLQNYIKDYAPNYKKMVNEYPEVNAVATSMDGNMYCFPIFVNTLTMAENILDIRTDWLKQLGKSTPTTIDEFLDVCESCKKWDPSKIPVTFSKYEFRGVLQTFLPSFGNLVDYRYGLDESDKVIYAPSTEQYKLTLMFMNSLYKNKYLDNECFAQDKAQVMAKVKENIAMITNGWGAILSPDDFDGKDIYVEILEPLTSKYYSKKHVRGFDNIFGAQIAITNKIKYPEAMVRWLDINYSDEDVAPEIMKGVNCISLWLGIEGQDWKYEGEDKTVYCRIIPPDIQTSEIEYSERYVSPGWGPCKLEMLAMPEKEKNPGQYMRAFQSKEHHYPFMEPGFKYNYLKYTPEEQERLKILENDIDSYTTQMEAKFITGQENFENWDKHVQKLKEMGVDELIKIKQNAYERYKLLLK